MQDNTHCFCSCPSSHLFHHRSLSGLSVKISEADIHTDNFQSLPVLGMVFRIKCSFHFPGIAITGLCFVKFSFLFSSIPQEPPSVDMAFQREDSLALQSYWPVLSALVDESHQVLWTTICSICSNIFFLDPPLLRVVFIAPECVLFSVCFLMQSVKRFFYNKIDTVNESQHGPSSFP